ncbi:MAG TPA: pyridine nucleotide-disulfide oxidoreductase [Paenibacillaceae bacterium]|nr:pyridine nucleotide-disulfide oxidoreductase [Paenibacillaceae bacterium]
MYDCVIIGGGIAGLQASIQLGRYMYKVVIIDRQGGRSVLAKRYMNVLGWPKGVSGKELLAKGVEQANAVGVNFLEGEVKDVRKEEDGFTLLLDRGESIRCKRLLLSTGVDDQFPSIEGLGETLGTSFYVCPDCDGYEIQNKKTVVVGSGNSGAAISCILTHWNETIVYINHEPEKNISAKWRGNCQEKNIPIIEGPVLRIVSSNENQLSHIELIDGQTIPAEKGFVAFEGKRPVNELAKQLGVALDEHGSGLVDGRTQQTNVENLWAAGDVVLHSQLVTRAMGDGSQAAIWIHKSLK